MEWGELRNVKAREQWDTMYNIALKYVRENGSIRKMPYSYVTKDGIKLGKWVRQQKRRRKSETEHPKEMSNKMIAKLDIIGIN